MKPDLHLSRTRFPLAIILATIIGFPAIWCQETRPYDVCGQLVECGNIQLEYPFWGLGRPAYCGHSGFELTCQSNVPILNYESLNYRLLGMNTSMKTITFARDDLWSNLCPTYLYNTTYNSTIFDGDNFRQENISLYYGCNSSILIEEMNRNDQFSCDMNDANITAYFYTTWRIYPSSSMSRLLSESCNNHIIVPVKPYFADLIESGDSITRDMREAAMAGFDLQWTVNNNECDQCIRSGGRCGSNSTSLELFACLHSGGSKGAHVWKLIIGFSCGIVGITLLLFVILCRKKRSLETQRATNHQIEIFIRNHGTLAPKRYKYSEIKKMTNSFLEKLGQGGYGSVYKGQLHNGHLVAVKLLDGAMGDGEDFINEVASIGRTSHVNIVTLLGFCFEGKKRALMYEFMPNGSLDKFLRSDDSRLDWKTLFQIAKGIARGLEYLHQGCNTRIVHFDIKPHNILLDEELVPKISDFGLAKLCKRKESIMSVMGARGTAGYMAPEVYFRSLGGASHKSDVYSFGMMILEMTGARKNNNVSATSTSEAYFPDWIYKQVESGENLGVNVVTSEEEEELARKMVMVSLWCIQSDPSDRPSISKVVEMLEGSFESLQVPPRRFWSSPTKPAQATQSSTSEIILTVQAAGEGFSS